MEIILAILVILVGLALYIYFSGPSFPPETDAIIDEVINSQFPQVVVGKTGLVSSGGLDIWHECISPPGPAKGTVLLLMGMGGDGFFWPPKFMQAFQDEGYQVIRYDHRGTGMSDWMKDWDRKQPYSLEDMAGDAVAILDTLEIEQAHLVGLSMGGMIAQEIAANYPGRVATLTLMMTSGFIGDPQLPGPSTRYFIRSLVTGLPLLKYRIMGGEKNLIKERIAKTISTSGDEGLDVRELAVLVLYDQRERRGINLIAVLQHQTAITNSGSRYEKLKYVQVATLVIHGTEDRFIPIEHGRRLVEVLPNARGLWLEGVGHVFPPPNLGNMMSEILIHLNEA